jgi:flagellar basal-body rod protein FlgC
MDIAASGLSVQRTRMSLVASNLANMHSTRDPEIEGPYRRREVVVEALPIAEFQEIMGGALGADSDAMWADPELQEALRMVSVSEVRIDDAPPLRVHDPGHPDADADGYVLMPNIVPMREMTDMMDAARAYEANLAILRTLRDMSQSALDIGAL